MGRVASSLTLLRNAEIYDPAPRGRHDVLVGGGSILGLGRSLPPSALYEVVDLEGARLIPGLIDSHVHVTGGGGEAGPATRVPPVVLSALEQVNRRHFGEIIGNTIQVR